jgi:hypothetical protein
MDIITPPATNVANSGNGGYAASGSAGGVNGNSGVVILKFPETYNLEIGAGLTASTSIVGTNKITTFTAGTGTVRWSL